ncbi:MAG: hypothetical protein HYY24_24655 [Verrucomicrobia bacterium]|nr:hypothetical protein [Verrucomicrobiota bacterium]
MTKRIQTQVRKLTDGTRLLRFSERKSGVSLEKRLDTREPVFAQKRRLLREFQSLIERELSAHSA